MFKFKTPNPQLKHYKHKLIKKETFPLNWTYKSNNTNKESKTETQENNKLLMITMQDSLS